MRGGAAALLAVAALAVAGCGGNAEDDYAAGWDTVCGDVRDAYRSFRTDVVSAAKSAPDAGDAAAGRTLPAAAVSGELGRPVRKLDRALAKPFADARALEPPARWSAWHRSALRGLDRQRAVVDDAARRVQAGDADAFSALSLGGFGPAAVSAPADLRDRTPVCTALN